MSALQLLHITCVAVYVFLAVYVVWRAPRHQRNLAFVGIALCFAWWSTSLALAHDPDASLSEATTGYNAGAVAWASFASFALWFGLAFSGHRDRLASRWVQACLVIPPIVVMTQQWRGQLAASYPRQSWGWAYDWSASPWTFFFYAYYATYVSLALLIAFRTSRTAAHPLVRRQASIIIYTALVPFVLSTTTDVVLPWMDIHTVPNIAPAFLLVWTAGIAIAIVRYRMLEISPESVADEIIEAMSDGLLLVDPQGRIASSNPAACRLFGRTASELRGNSLQDVLERTTRSAGEGELVPTDLQIVSANGADQSVSLSRSDIKDPNGTLVGALCLFRDITEHKRAERALQRAHDELETRVTERTHELDDAYHELRRYSRSRAGLHAAADAIHKGGRLADIGLNVARALPSGFGPDVVTGCRVTIDSESYDSEPFVLSDRVERAVIRAGGEPRGAVEAHLDGASAQLAGEDRRLVDDVAIELGQAMDALRMQRALAQSDRLASIGLLAAGVAHEVNNPLTYVMSNLGEILAHLERCSTAAHSAFSVAELRDHAREAMEGCEHVARVVRELGAFSRDGDNVSVIQIAQPVDSAIAMATNVIRHRARLSCEHMDSDPVRADAGRLAQVFLNILVNATQAIPEGDVANNEIRVRTWQDGDGVLVEVRDTGPGIPAEMLPKIFDPFFSTKQTGKGTGLGLAICRDIVAAAGGEISADSIAGQGACFRVRLPRVERTALAAPAASRSASAPLPSASRSARILIIDDEPRVARALHRILRAYDCVVTTSGEEGKRALQGDREFDLIFCDIMMPDVSGVDLHAWLLETNPRLANRMYFVTGGAFTDLAKQLVQRLPGRVIAKPFDVAEIRQLVSELLA